jgi:type IV pilus assembly protein PilQ
MQANLGRAIFYLAIAAVVLTPLTRPTRVGAEEVRGSKGPDGDGVPDLDDVISGGKAKGGGSGEGDADSLGDLEKVIADEDSKGGDAKPKSDDAPPPPPQEKAEAEPPPPAAPAGDESLDIPQGNKEDLSALEKDLKSEAKAQSQVDQKQASPPADGDNRDTAALPDNPPAGDKSADAPTPPADNGDGNHAETLSDDAASTEKNSITNLEFRMEGKNSRIIISSQHKLAYRETDNPKMKQFVYYFDNSDTPERLQRAYDTTEFASPIALFTLLQVPGSPTPLSKLIIQLREEQKPSVTGNDRGLIIEFPPPTEGSDTKIALGDGDKRALTDENIYSGKQAFYGHIIRRLEIKNSDVQDVLRLIARVSGYSIVVGDDVTGRVGTLSLENIPWDQAFTLVLQSKKLGYIREGNVLRVGTNSALKAEKDEALAIEQAKLKIEPLRTVLIPVSYAKAADLAPKAKNFLTERGTADTDTRSNTLIVKDIEKVVERVQKLISALDTPPARVAISAKFVEVQSELIRELGFTALTSTNISPGFAGINLTTTNTIASNGGTSLTTINASQLGIVNAQLQIGEEDHKTKTLANPSVSVVANQTASISQGITFFIPSNQVVGTSLVSGNQQINATLTLNVTPIVSGDGSIFLTVKIDNQIPHINGASSTIDTRSVDTQILVENGDTAVIGGVYNNVYDTDLIGIPFLMRIPILGYLFSSSVTTDQRNELFVFITAKIMNAEEAFKRNL